MYILMLYIALIAGGPEQGYVVQAYTSELQCEQAKQDIWAQMNRSYPEEERILYRFLCLKKPLSQPLRRVYVTDNNLHGRHR